MKTKNNLALRTAVDEELAAGKRSRGVFIAMTSWNDIEIQPDKSLLIRRYRNGRCYAVRLACGTSCESAISVGNEFGYDYEPYNEATGEFLPGKTVHIKG